MTTYIHNKICGIHPRYIHHKSELSQSRHEVFLHARLLLVSWAPRDGFGGRSGLPSLTAMVNKWLSLRMLTMLELIIFSHQKSIKVKFLLIFLWWLKYVRVRILNSLDIDLILMDYIIFPNIKHPHGMVEHVYTLENHPVKHVFCGCFISTG